MNLALILIVMAVAAVVAVAYIGKRATPTNAADQSCGNGDAACGSCSASYGSSECLGKKSLRQAVEAPVYFDDEELDAYKGRHPSSYTDDETEQFAEVLYTMNPAEIGTWLASLALRGIELPASLRPEAEMLMG